METHSFIYEYILRVCSIFLMHRGLLNIDMVMMISLWCLQELQRTLEYRLDVRFRFLWIKYTSKNGFDYIKWIMLGPMPLKRSACLDLMTVCILDIDLMYEIHISMVVWNCKDRSDHRKLILLDLMLVYSCMNRSKGLYVFQL